MPNAEPSQSEERQPLLGDADSGRNEVPETKAQRRLQEKLHTFQIGRALSLGYMPSNVQILAYIKAALDSGGFDVGQELSPTGRDLVRLARTWLEEMSTLVEHKNGDDQLQDLVWWLSRSEIADSSVSATAPSKSSYETWQLVATLLLADENVRSFSMDVATIGRAAFQESVESSKVADGIADKTKAIAGRLKDALDELRQRPDFEKTVYMLSALLQQYATAYAREAEERIEEVKHQVKATLGADVHPTREEESDEIAALRRFGRLLISFGDRAAWEELGTRFGRVLDRSKGEDKHQFDAFIQQAGNTLQQILLDPEFLDHADDHIEALEKQLRDLDKPPSDDAAAQSTTLRQDLDSLLSQVQATLQSVAEDPDILRLVKTSRQIADIVCPPGQPGFNPGLLTDAINTFLPTYLEALHYIPIPRIELASPVADVLVENLVLEPGSTINNSSFLPYRLHVEMRNDIDIRKARFGTAASVKTMASISVDGLTVAAEGIGYVLRLRAAGGPLSSVLSCSLMPALTIADEGFVSFHLDERGMDVHLDVEVIRNQPDRMLALRAVHVKIHHLSYTRTSQATGAATKVINWLAWLSRPIAVPIIRRQVEKQVAKSLKEALRVFNRELVFARERLRAVHVASPNSGLATLAKALLARQNTVSADDPDRQVRIGILPSKHGVFSGVYAPGSLSRVWEQEMVSQANGPTPKQYRRDGWRSDAFDLL